MLCCSPWTRIWPHQLGNPGRATETQTHHDRGSDFFDELSVLRAINVGSKGVLLDAASPGYHSFVRIATGSSPGAGHVPSHDGLDLLRFLHDLLRHGPLDAVAGDDDTVLLARSPPLEQLSADAVLQHTGGGEHDTAANIIKAVKVLQ